MAGTWLRKHVLKQEILATEAKKNQTVICILGNAQNKLRDKQGALLSYCRSLELNPKQFHSYTALGNTLFQLGQTEEAIAAYNQALKLQPNNKNLCKIVKKLKKIYAKSSS